MRYLNNKIELKKVTLKSIILLFLLALPVANASATYLTTDDNAKVYYNVQGEGEAIVFIHGVLVNSLFWEKNIEELAKEFKVITIDMRGHGYTVDNNVADYTLERVAKDVKLLLENLNIENATLVGWSTGGFVSYKYVELFGNYRLKGVCIVDMPAKILNENGWKYGSFDKTTFEQMVATIPSTDFQLRQAFVPQVFAQNSIVDEATLDFTERNFMLSPTSAFISYMSQLASHDFREVVKNLPVPHLYLHGGKSQLYPIAVGEWLEANLPAFPQNRVVTFTESGHTPHMEESKKFNKVLKDFVNSLSN